MNVKCNVLSRHRRRQQAELLFHHEEEEGREEDGKISQGAVHGELS